MAAGRAILCWQPAGSTDIWRISTQVRCSLGVCLQHPNDEKMRSSCCSSAERSFKSYNARDLGFPPIRSRFRHTAADLTKKTCSATAAKCKARTDPAQKMCAATGVPQKSSNLPVCFLQAEKQ